MMLKGTVGRWPDARATRVSRVDYIDITSTDARKSPFSCFGVSDVDQTDARKERRQNRPKPPVARAKFCSPDRFLAEEVKSDPAGRSNLAAYQTCRAGFSFGRTASRRSDTGRPPGLCTLAHSVGSTCEFRQRQGTRRPKTVVVVAVVRLVVVAVGRADVRRLIVERAATQNTATR